MSQSWQPQPTTARLPLFAWSPELHPQEHIPCALRTNAMKKRKWDEIEEDVREAVISWWKRGDGIDGWWGAEERMELMGLSDEWFWFDHKVDSNVVWFTKPVWKTKFYMMKYDWERNKNYLIYIYSTYKNRIQQVFVYF